jgi:hypothetical protein
MKNKTSDLFVSIYHPFQWGLCLVSSFLIHVLLFLSFSKRTSSFFDPSPTLNKSNESTQIEILDPSYFSDDEVLEKPQSSLEPSKKNRGNFDTKPFPQKPHSSSLDHSSPPSSIFLAESDDDLFKDDAETVYLSPENLLHSTQEETGFSNSSASDLSEKFAPEGGDLQGLDRPTTLRGVWTKSRAERHRASAIHQGSLSLYFMKLDERLMSAWGGVRRLPSHSTFVGRHQEIISYDFLIDQSGDLIEIVNVTQREQPHRNFEDVDRLVESVFRHVFPWQPLPHDHEGDPILFRKQIRYIGDHWGIL